MGLPERTPRHVGNFDLLLRERVDRHIDRAAALDLRPFVRQLVEHHPSVVGRNEQRVVDAQFEAVALRQPPRVVECETREVGHRAVLPWRVPSCMAKCAASSSPATTPAISTR